METVGVYLKREREANKISLHDVAQITKIMGSYLEYIEKDEFDKIPQGPYIKGYLSSYSRAIGCDADHAIRLYESANRQRSQAETDLSATEPIDAGQVSGKPFKEPPQAQASHPRWGKPGSWLTRPLSAVLTLCGSSKAAKKPIETSDTSLPIIIRPFRHLIGRVKQPGLRTLIFRSTNRRRWIYASMAIFGAFILFLAAAGFYHLFLFDPGSVIVAEAETSANEKNFRASDAGALPSTLPSAPTDTPRAAEPPQDHVTNKVLSVAAESAPGVSGTQAEADTAYATPEPATQVVAASSADSSATRHAADLPRHGSGASGVDPSRKKTAKKDSSPKQTIPGASLKVSKASICRSIENRMPAGVDQLFSPSDGKIYVWSMIESNQGPSTIHHIYYFEGKKISDVSLDVRSAHWRTWSSKTIANNRYRGKWHVDITTSNGDLLRRLFFEVK